MHKIVINNCYGGFSVSAALVRLARELSGDPKWGGCTLEGECYEDGTLCTCDYTHSLNVERHDPILVQAVEQLGEQASGRCSNLVVVTINCNQYRINEYDGAESVETPDSINWTTIN